MPSWMIFRSVPQMPQARTFTRTSSSPGTGTGRSKSSNRCGATSTAAVILSGMGMEAPFGIDVIGVGGGSVARPGSPRRPTARGCYPARVNLDAFTLLLALGALAAGFLGSLTGLGGGVVIVPLLTLGFGVDIRYAIGASLVSVIATSSAAAAAYVKEGYTNLRIGMFVEIATTVGALVGAFLAQKLSV